MYSQNNKTGAYKKTTITSSEKISKTIKTEVQTLSTQRTRILEQSKEKKSLCRKSTGSMQLSSPLSSSLLFKSEFNDSTRIGTSSARCPPNLKLSLSYPNFPSSNVLTKSTVTTTPKLIGKNNSQVLPKLSEDSVSFHQNPFTKEFSMMAITNSPKKTTTLSKTEYISPYSGNAFQRPSPSLSYKSSNSNLTTSTPKYYPTSSLLLQQQKKTPSITFPESKTFPKKEIQQNKILKMKKGSPGICYIFNHENFDSSAIEYREGSQVDVCRLKKTFKVFGVKIMNLFNNLTVKQIKKEMNNIEKKDFNKHSCIIIVILSHGNRLEQIRAKDGIYSIDDDILFPILRNKTLETKPKILLIQACKGEIDPREYLTDSIQNIGHGKPTEILKCYSTFEGFVSYRTSNGSIFIQTFCELLEENGHNKDIREIMDLVRERVKLETGDKQIPSVSTTLTKSYIFGDYV